MKTIHLGVLCGFLLGLNASAVVEPPLPNWSAEERKAMEEQGWLAGGLLLTDETEEEAPEETPPEPLDVEAPTADELAEDEPPASEIAEKYLAEYFDQRPKDFLVDPQGLLNSKDRMDRLGFLNYHAGDSSIDLFIYVFNGDQEIPGDVREEEVIERFFSEGKPAAVVCYYLGAPQRSVIYLSPSLTDVVSAAEQRRALQSSVIQAFESVHPPDQLEAFLVQMSIRIYWMERMLAGKSIQEEAVALPIKTGVENTTMAGSEIAVSRMKELVLPWLPHVAFFFSIILLGIGARYWLARKARFRFPEFDVEPRLGGSHAAGVGAVISFASASVPPASQRDQVPDYLRRA